MQKANQDHVVSIVTRQGLHNQGIVVQFLAGARGFFFFRASKLSVGPIQPNMSCVLEALSTGVKRLEHGIDHSPPSSAKVKGIK
jgi:hypothetical protein